MTSQKTDRTGFWSSPTATLLNTGLAGGIGFAIAGLAGAAIGIAGFVTVFLLPALTRWITRHADGVADHPGAKAIASTARIVALPGVMLLAVAVSVFAFGVGIMGLARQRMRGMMPEISLPARPKISFQRPKSKAKPGSDFWSADNLAITIANIIFAIVLGCMWFGMQVAFYAALVATPIWLVVLVAVAFEAAEPDRPIPLPNDDDRGPY
jgi:hypothetical protein